VLAALVVAGVTIGDQVIERENTLRAEAAEREDVLRRQALEKEQETHAAGLVGRVFNASITHLPDVIKDLRPYRTWTDLLLQEAKAKYPLDSRKQLHASLALLPVDPSQADYVYRRLLKADPQEFLVLREALKEHQDRLKESLWAVLENPKCDQDERLRAAGALALYAPEDARWNESVDDVAMTLVIQKPFVLADWMDALNGVGGKLMSPLCVFLVDDTRTVAERALIARIYGHYASQTPDGYVALQTILSGTFPPDLAKMHVSYALGAFVMGKEEFVWPLLKHSANPTVRSYLIERFAPAGVDPQVLVARLKVEKETSVKRAILLSLGEFGPNRLIQTERKKLLPWLLDVYHNEPDSGMHGACEWLLRRWQAPQLESINAKIVTGKVEGNRHWYINRQGMTMVVISKPRDGATWTETGEKTPRLQPGHAYAISSHDVTMAQFLPFFKERGDTQKKGLYLKKYSSKLDLPAPEVSWYEAAEYCNWLSMSEGIPESEWCYEPNPAGKYAEGMKIKADYLSLKGYRMPTEIEWEHACRAGSTVSYCFGNPVELLEKYAWYERSSLSSVRPSGLLKPNDFGLFDMHGNVYQWVHDVPRKGATQEEDKADVIRNKIPRAGKGGSWFSIARDCRITTSRFNGYPAMTEQVMGFRVARIHEEPEAE
jgi:formylglycine-generating enzyme required for sulfatase activity